MWLYHSVFAYYKSMTITGRRERSITGFTITDWLRGHEIIAGIILKRIIKVFSDNELIIHKTITTKNYNNHNKRNMDFEHLAPYHSSLSSEVITAKTQPEWPFLGGQTLEILFPPNCEQNKLPFLSSLFVENRFFSHSAYPDYNFPSDSSS